jgi:hypothetical protein
MSFKIVINKSYGGFSLSEKAKEIWYSITVDKDDCASFIENRTHPALISLVEHLGEDANGRSAKLKVVEVPDWLKEKGWMIQEYDGMEYIAERHHTWS